MAEFQIKTGAAPTTPPAGYVTIFAKATDKLPYIKDEAGLEHLVANIQMITGNSGTPQLVAGQTRYLSLGVIDTEEVNVWAPVTRACTIKNLRIVSGTSPGAGQTYTATLRKTLANTAVTCQIVAGSNEASDTTHSQAFAAVGDRWDILVAASSSANPTAISFALEIHT